VLGPFSIDHEVPTQVRELVEEEEESDMDAEGFEPLVIVVTEPTELIVSDGDPSWSPVEGMALLFMSNTESNVFLDLTSGDHFLLLGGRWFRGSLGQVDVDWQAVANDALPEAFADIAEDSSRSEVLSHVAGTAQARTALLENTLPHTSAVQREDTSFEADWDGDPQFETIDAMTDEGDVVQYATNTPDSIFKVGHRYYACEQGVWFEASSAFGPWLVAVEIPDVIYDIPPSNPHYNVTYVRVYDVTPEVVYVGYTPGYLGSYYYHGSVVYGTGWHYDPWYSAYYYPRRLTFGYSPYYDPWYGWRPSHYSPYAYRVGYRPRHNRRHVPVWFGSNNTRRHGYSNQADRDRRSRHQRNRHQYNSGRRFANSSIRVDRYRNKNHRREDDARLHSIDRSQRSDADRNNRNRNTQQRADAAAQSRRSVSQSRSNQQITGRKGLKQQRPERTRKATRELDGQSQDLQISRFKQPAGKINRDRSKIATQNRSSIKTRNRSAITPQTRSARTIENRISRVHQNRSPDKVQNRTQARKRTQEERPVVQSYTSAARKNRSTDNIQAASKPSVESKASHPRSSSRDAAPASPRSRHKDRPRKAHNLSRSKRNRR